MDHAFAVRILSKFVHDVNEYLGVLDESWDGNWPAAPEALELDEVRAKMIENAYVPSLGDYEAPVNWRDHWELARQNAIQALGRATSVDEIAAFLRPTSPAIAADNLHPWVWGPAAPLWEADGLQDAVLSAARTVNRRLQQKLGRHDVGDYNLAMQAFDLKEPEVGKPRLRCPGDQTTPTWKARQEGAKYVTAGAFLAIRNTAAHEDSTDWSKQEALEYLATLSVVARWIEACSVETAN